MTNQIIDRLLAKSRRTDIPNFGPGDTIKVQVKIKEGDKERIQAFEGVVISRTRGPQASFTVRKISFGQGVERIFPVQSKVIDKIDVLRSAKESTCSGGGFAKTLSGLRILLEGNHVVIVGAQRGTEFPHPVVDLARLVEVRVDRIFDGDHVVAPDAAVVAGH